MAQTPLQPAERISSDLGVYLYFKRDDLFPALGGGNKARKLSKIIPELEQNGYNALVTTGGLQSNHARATALIAAEKGWPCKLILHGNPVEIGKESGNLLLMRLSGAEIIYVQPDEISDAMNDALLRLRADGYKPAEIPGGGHCIAGSMSYVEAMDEIVDQCRDVGWFPDYIILPSGTGTTQAGIIAGVKREGLKSRVVGISVARDNPRGRTVIIESYSGLCDLLDIPFKEEDINFKDEWTYGGYECAGEQIFSTILWAARIEGLILDPTYTGKAMTALIDLVKRGEIKKGANVLFWHTGGILNLMASKQLLDYLKRTK